MIFTECLGWKGWCGSDVDYLFDETKLEVWFDEIQINLEKCKIIEDWLIRNFNEHHLRTNPSTK